ncbi:hypothetical protein ARALYDRAFT_341554 [Arabidopsis lyrata subsp. lyrata]|uniref:Myb/SANT-like DNA-binding domain-containing protein n=1 Tax=Arabidopsis lyrata subsp. lyrata TaxID=81972 RepID=D7L2D5_ARALL|nr:hypothetical protein ARALYDRAFT_341554 [Arabidopsis lyrata subsp. lyrata]
MEEDDETQSRPSPTDTSTAKSPGRSGLALVVSCPNQAASGRRSGGGGGRDDSWSEEATEILINAWGERYLELKRGNLKQQHWKEVAEIVNRDNKSPKTDIHCKNRIDTVKKKFKLEKAKIAAGKELLLRRSQSLNLNFLLTLPLPPLLLPTPVTLDKTGGGGGREVGEVAMAIVGFAESYEKVETLKLKQMVELEKEKMKFSKELELQRIHFFKAQLEMLRNCLEDRDS